MRNRKTGIAIALIFFLAIGLIPLGSDRYSYAMNASDFKDVSQDYWGYNYIDFSAKNGIINGYLSYDGSYSFLPENSVTKEESLSMIYRMLSSVSKLKSQEDYSAEYDSKLKENKISDWARKYVAYGLKYGIIKESELADFTDENAAGITAPREQVAMWAAKAMGKSLAPAYSLIYADKDSISSEKLPYVDLLYRQGIMRGDDTKMFNPASGIKRAEFAAICNRVYESFKNEAFDTAKEVQSFRGTIVSVDTYSSRIMMTLYDGTSKVIQVNPKTQIVINGKVNYNGLGEIPTGTVAVLGWGAFNGSGTSTDGVLQLHVTTKEQVMTGLLSATEKMDNNNTIISIENQDGDVILYLKDKNSIFEGTPQKGKEISFLTDGIKILELK